MTFDKLELDKLHELAKLRLDLKDARRRAIPDREIPGVLAMIRAGDRQAAAHLRRGLEWIVLDTVLAKLDSLGPDDRDDLWERLSQYYTAFDDVLAALPRNKIMDVARRLRGEFAFVNRDFGKWTTRHVWQSGHGSERYPRKSLRQKQNEKALHRSDRSECRSAYDVVASREAAERYASRWFPTWMRALAYCESPREREIVGYLRDGCDPGEVAKMLHTDRSYIERIMDSVTAKMYWAGEGDIVCYDGESLATIPSVSNYVSRARLVCYDSAG